MPTSHCRSPDSISLTGLASLVTWVQGRMTLDTKPTSTPSQAPRTCLALLKAMETFVCRDVTELVLVFVLICRSLGYSARFLRAATKCQNISTKSTIELSQCLSLTFISPRFVANLALISPKPTEDVKLSGEGSLNLKHPTLHGRSLGLTCT